MIATSKSLAVAAVMHDLPSSTAQIVDLNNYFPPADGVSSYLFNFKQFENIVAEVFSEKQDAGWNGYEALPITQASKSCALKIAKRLPNGIEFPEIIPTSSGGYSLEWRSLDKYLVIEIENDEVSCVFLSKDNSRKKSFFTKDFDVGSDDLDILNWIKKAFSING